MLMCFLWDWLEVAQGLRKIRMALVNRDRAANGAFAQSPAAGIQSFHEDERVSTHSRFP